MGLRKKIEEKVLDVDASMQGSLSFKDPVNLRINGRFEGNLEVKGVLTISSSAVVKADIVGDKIIIGGRVKGKIIAREMLTLLSTAISEGEIFPAKLSIEEGAIFDGKCYMLHDFLTAEELARYLEVDLNSIVEWASSGKIPGTREGNNWKFERKNVDAWIASGKVK
ncbi:MAG: polymer-forming cytoskeletal protein [Candidatus Omnitrophica bacterium]|nr:polymer-forming cytoskeletal protein [Candidatus Omnitrophota bacterium]MBU1871395.1 polymer-forming cytoskeletal protein [Candidatus Omnitrophota bacterium]